MINSADYGDPTTRTRFFLMARKDGNPLVWPEPSHAKGDAPMFSGRKPWRPAREIIEWQHHGRSIIDDPKYQRKPLAINTRLRIARGILRFGGPLANLYISLLDIPEQLLPATAETRGDNTIPACPKATHFIHANRNNNAPKSMDEPIPTITTTTGGGSFFIEAGFRPFTLGQQSCSAPRSTDLPTHTIATAGAISLVQPSIIQYYGQSYAQSIHHPLSSITGSGKHALIEHIATTLQDAHDDSEPLPEDTQPDRVTITIPGPDDPNIPKLVEQGVNPKRLIYIDGKPHLLDILFRMLQNLELARAMGFNDESDDYQFIGNKSQVTKQIGNAVPVNTATALISSILDQMNIATHDAAC